MKRREVYSDKELLRRFSELMDDLRKNPRMCDEWCDDCGRKTCFEAFADSEAREDEVEEWRNRSRIPEQGEPICCVTCENYDEDELATSLCMKDGKCRELPDNECYRSCQGYHRTSESFTDLERRWHWSRFNNSRAEMWRARGPELRRIVSGDDKKHTTESEEA